ncbi:hypothetical protein TrLO_g975 [Triparma laevis f. longispina]|uniref:CCHC-type domain-containing protein n=1 Tax=Triparma laevis f. longispina TaxID=1714387 RepID=A0A9W6ZGA1_9STRA|nr:hypothetical protein TrLO_g975 [Triparma laevis f. longispina]
MNFFNQVLVTALVMLMVLNIVETLNPNSERFLYVLNLKRGFKYVGSTTNINQRLKMHKNRKATKWTNLHEMINVSKTQQLPPSMSNEHARLQEDLLVKTLMLDHGIERVRGGSFSSVTLSDYQVKTLRQIFHHAKDRCYNCGETGHFAADCPNTINADNAPMKKYAQPSNMRKHAEKPDEPERDLDVLLEEDGAKQIREHLLTLNSDEAIVEKINDMLKTLDNLYKEMRVHLGPAVEEMWDEVAALSRQCLCIENDHYVKLEELVSAYDEAELAYNTASDKVSKDLEEKRTKAKSFMSREDILKWRELEAYEKELLDLYTSSDIEDDEEDNEEEADPTTAFNLQRLNEDVVALNDKLRALEEETKLKDKKIVELNETVKVGEFERSGLDEKVKESEKIRSLLDRRLQDIEARLRGQTRSCNTIESTLRQSEESKRSLSDRLQLSETKLQESMKVIRELRSTNEILLSSLAKEQARVDKLQGGVMANSGLTNEISDLKEQLELYTTAAQPRRRKRFGPFRPIWRRK